MKRGDLIEIEWVDVIIHPGWSETPEKLPGYLAKSVGYFVNQDNKYLRLAHTIGADGQVADVSVIPNTLIIDKPKALKSP